MIDRFVGRRLAACALAAATAAPLHAAAPTPGVAPLAQRLSDEALVADQRVYEAHEARLAALNARGHRLGATAMAKARCWMEASAHEHARNDPSDFPRAALARASRWLDVVEHGSAAPDDDAETARTAAPRPAVDGVGPRDALRARLAGLRARGAAACAAAEAPLACAGVRLLHAEHELAQHGWRHAAPYVALAEDLAAEAEGALERCQR